MTPEDIEKVIKVADRIAKAVASKLGVANPNKASMYIPRVRRFENKGIGYVEIAMAPNESTHSSQEISTAYSDDFFLSITPDNIKDRAKRVLDDFKITITGKR